MTTLIAVALLLLSAAVARGAQDNGGITSATVIPALPCAAGLLDTTDATTAADDPDCVGNGPTVWYVFTSAVNVSVLANTFGSDYDIMLSVYTDSRNALIQIACRKVWGQVLKDKIGAGLPPPCPDPCASHSQEPSLRSPHEGTPDPPSPRCRRPPSLP